MKYYANHVFSILKKKRLRDERLSSIREDSLEIGSLRVEYVERKPIILVWGMPKPLIWLPYLHIKFIFTHPQYEGMRLYK